VLLGAVPFITLQLALDYGVTGHATQTPWALYARQNDPLDGLVVGPLSTVKPQTTLPQKLEFSEQVTNSSARGSREPGQLHRWATNQLPNAATVIVPQVLLLMLIPVGWLAVRDNAHQTMCVRAALYSTVPLSVFAYAFYTFASPHYQLSVTPGGALGVVLGIEALTRAFPAARSFFRAFLVPCVLGISMTEMPQFNRYVLDDQWRPPEPRLIEDALAKIAHKPAVVLFHYTPHVDNPQAEPVYNTDVAWPDDASVIRAHDFGPQKDRAIFEYFAARQPGRYFYLYDRQHNALHRLGTARDLAQNPPTTLPVE
jgi:hypothetical protein